MKLINVEKLQKLENSILYKEYIKMGFGFKLVDDLLVINCNGVLSEVVNFYNLIVVSLELKDAGLGLVVENENFAVNYRIIEYIARDYKNIILLKRVLTEEDNETLNGDIIVNTLSELSSFHLCNNPLNDAAKAYILGVQILYERSIISYKVDGLVCSFLIDEIKSYKESKRKKEVLSDTKDNMR